MMSDIEKSFEASSTDNETTVHDTSISTGAEHGGEKNDEIYLSGVRLWLLLLGLCLAIFLMGLVRSICVSLGRILTRTG